jgi:hypothetical protein
LQPQLEADAPVTTHVAHRQLSDYLSIGRDRIDLRTVNISNRASLAAEKRP